MSYQKDMEIKYGKVNPKKYKIVKRKNKLKYDIDYCEECYLNLRMGEFPVECICVEVYYREICDMDVERENIF